MTNQHNQPEFDQFARGYDAALGPGIRFTGASRGDFATIRISYLKKILEQHGITTPLTILDYGCGIGTHFQSLLDNFPTATITATDVSLESLDQARNSHGGLLAKGRLEIRAIMDLGGSYDLIFLHGVLHHVPIAARHSVLSQLKQICTGEMVVSENNTMNPLMWLTMRMAPMDRDANPVSRQTCRNLVQKCGFRVGHTHGLFHLPPLFYSRWPKLCHSMSGIPLASQYLMICYPK